MRKEKSGDEHEELIERLKAEAAYAAGGRMVVYESEQMTPAVREQFWRNVVACESTAAVTNLTRELTAVGVELPEPADLDDAALHKALWRVIEELANLGVFLHFTDHLSDRELYTKLVNELLPEEMDALDDDGTTSWHIHVLESDEHELFLKYFADEKTREEWRSDNPEDPIPAREPRPYDRDRHLPDIGI